MLRIESPYVNGETARENPPIAPRSRPWVHRRRRSSRPPCNILAPAPADFWVPMPPSATFALLSPLSSSPLNSFLVLYPWSNLPGGPGRSRTPGRLQLPYLVLAVDDLPPPAKRLHCADAIPCGLTAATVKWSFYCETVCLPAPRLDVKVVFHETPVEAAADPRKLLRCVRDLPPPPDRTALPYGPGSV